MSTYLNLILKDLKQYQVSNDIRSSFYNNNIDPTTYKSQEFEDYLQYIEFLKEAYPNYKSQIVEQALGERNIVDVFISNHYYMVSNRLDVLKENAKIIISNPKDFDSFLKSLLNYEWDKTHPHLEIIKKSQTDNLKFLIEFGRRNKFFMNLDKNDLITKNEDFLNILKSENLISSDRFNIDDFKKIISESARNYSHRHTMLNKLFTAYFENFIDIFKSPNDFIEYKEKNFKKITTNSENKEQISYKMDEVDFLEHFAIELKLNEKKELQSQFLESWLKDEKIESAFLNSKEKMIKLLSNNTNVFISFVRKNFNKIVDKTIIQDFDYYGVLSWDLSGRSYRKNDNLLTQINSFFTDTKIANKQDFDNLFLLVKDTYKELNKNLENWLKISSKDEDKEKIEEMKGYVAYCVMTIAKNYKFPLDKDTTDFLNDVIKDNGKLIEKLSLKTSHSDDLKHLSDALLSLKKVENMDVTEINVENFILHHLMDIPKSNYQGRIEQRVNNILEIMNEWSLEDKIHKVDFKNITFSRHIGTGKSSKVMYDYPLMFVLLDNKKVFNEITVIDNLEDLKNTKYKNKNYFEYIFAHDTRLRANEKFMLLSEKPELFNELVVKNKKIKTLLEKNDMKDVLNVYSVIENYFKVDKKLKQKKEDPQSSSNGFKL